MSEEKDLTTYTVDNYHMADWREKKLYWVEVYRQRSQVAENEIRKERQKLRQAATAHDVPYLNSKHANGMTLRTYVGAPVLRSYCLLGAHKACAKCDRIILILQNIASYKNVYMKWKKKAKQLEDALNGVAQNKKVRKQEDQGQEPGKADA